MVVHNFTGANLDVHVDLSEQATSLTIPDGTEVHAAMGGGDYPSITSANRSFYPLGTLFGFTTRVLFLGDISKYQDDVGMFLTYDNAIAAGP